MSDLDFAHEFVPGKSGRTLLLLHGTGGDEHQLLDLGQAIDPQAALLSPRGKVSENGALRFFRRLAEGVFDEEDVVRRARELAEFIEDACAKYGIARDGLVAIGYSNGANIAAAILFLGLTPFARAVLLRPMVPLAQVQPNNLANVQALLAGGQFDPIAGPALVRDLADRLREGGAAVDLVIQPSGHELTHLDVETARQWLGNA